NSAGVLPAQLWDRTRKVYHVGRRSTLIVDHIQCGAACRELQNRIGETLAADSKEPRCSHDAAIPHQLEQFDLCLRLAASVYALRVARIVNLIRCALFSIKYVVGTQEEKPRSDFLRRRSHIHGTVAVHRKRQILIALAAVHNGVSSGQHDPVWMCFPNHSSHAIRISDIRILRTESCNRISTPFVHERLAEQAGRTKDGDSHWGLLESLGVCKRHAPLVFCRYD